jgi:hypothetical protein
MIPLRWERNAFQAHYNEDTNSATQGSHWDPRLHVMLFLEYMCVKEYIP